jgi:carbon storage regulator CsrA
MLVLNRKANEKVAIEGGTTVSVGRVRLGIDAPDDVRILRGELAFWLEEDGDESATE